MAHTPAPWEVRRNPYTGLVFVGEYPIFSDKHPGEHNNIHYANALLIAAAPDLLDALENLFEHCAMIHNHWGDGDNTKQADAAITQAQQAIKKARGE